MLIPLTLPPPVRKFLRDGMQLLVGRLAVLTEEFRAGLIAAIGRTLADGAEHIMDRVIPQSRTPRVHRVEQEYDSDDYDEPARHFAESRTEPMSYSPAPQEPHSENHTASPMTRALVAAGLNAFGVWLLRIGLVPTSAVIAVFGGMALLFRR